MTIDDIKIGSRWERWEAHRTGKIGEIITVIDIDIQYGTILFNGGRSLGLDRFLKRFRPLAEVEEEQPKAFYKESGEPWTREELQKLSTYLGINYLNPSEFKLDRKYIYNKDDGGYFPWGSQHPSKVEDIYDRISYESIFEPTKETPTRVSRSYIRIDELDSPEMAEFMEEWSKNYEYVTAKGKEVYVYEINGDYTNVCIGKPPNEWENKGYLSFIKCDNILEHENSERKGNIAACLTSLDLASASDSIAIAGDLYDGSCCIASDICPEWIPDQHLASAIAATTNQTKENTMNPTSAEIKIEVNGKAINLCKETKAVKPKTDLETRKKYTVVVFDVSGRYSETLYFNAKNEDKAIKKMTAILQNPANIGKTATLHREIEVLTTSIPVVKANV